jgi:uncharacterized protein with beta-barrel porin domain
MKRFARSTFSCIPAAAVAFAITPIATTDSAKAGCAPAAPVSNATVNCTDATTNQNDPNGYGTGVENGIVVNVRPGATVSGTTNGLFLNNSAVDNFGVITGGTRGVFSQESVNLINESGRVTATGNSNARAVSTGFANVTNSAVVSVGDALNNSVSNIAILSQSTANVFNTGTISAGAFSRGIAAVTNVNLDNRGTITAGANGTAVQSLNTLADVDNSASGTISGGAFGISSVISETTNAGTISATDATGIAIQSRLEATVFNSGSIKALGASGTAIRSEDIATVDNQAGGQIIGNLTAISADNIATVVNAVSGLISGGLFGIDASTVNVTGNAGTIEATAINGVAINANNATVANSGTIRGNGNGDGGRAIVGTGDVSATNFASGLIEANGQSGIAIEGGSTGTTTVSNAGTIQANGATGLAIEGGTLGGTTDVSNSGTIQANGPSGTAIDGGLSATNVSNSGLVRAAADEGTAIKGVGPLVVTNSIGGVIEANGPDGRAIGSLFATNITVNNAGTVQANGADGFAILGLAATINNSGTIQATANNGVAITAGNAQINNNAGATIVGNSGAIQIDTGTVNNAGTLSSTKPSTSIPTIFARTQATVNNTGTIFAPGSGFGIEVNNGRLDLFNSGTISGIDNAIGIDAAIANVTNTGTIITGSDSIIAKTANINNSGLISSAVSAISIKEGMVDNRGTIQASASAINVGNGTISNSGSISGTVAVHPSTFATISNTGIIQGIGPTGLGVAADNSANVSNTGTITGNIGIQADGRNNAGTVITNAGIIAGTGGTAIKLSAAADTLTLLPGSRVIGLIDMGGGADTINIFNSVVAASRVSSLTTLLSATVLPNVINFNGTLNTNTTTVSSGMPSVASQTQFATLDPTTFGQADRMLMNFTGGVSSLVQGRLGGTAANNSAVQVVSFAPTGASGRTNEAFAAISAMGYAAGWSRPLAHPFSYADAPYNVWTSGFGGTSTQKGDDTVLRSVASAGVGVIGVDRQVRPDLLIGAFAGGGTGRLSVELNSQSVDTDYVTGGFYGRFDWVSHFLDFTLQGGATVNKSKRLVLNDSVPGGSETATASYDGWYISPEVAYGRRYFFASGYTLTPLGRIRYLAGTFDGYNETGSAQNLVVNRRTMHDVEERAEVELSKITGVGVGSFRTSVHGGLIALQRLGNPTISTVLIGQDLSFTTPGKASSAGVVAGAGFDFRATDRMSLFGAVEGTLMSDHSRTAAAKAGLKVAF